jgi:hypothetical protein
MTGAWPRPDQPVMCRVRRRARELSSTTMSCAVAMTASARPSRRAGAPEPGVAVASDAAAVLTTRVGGPVSGGGHDNLPRLRA